MEVTRQRGAEAPRGPDPRQGPRRQDHRREPAVPPRGRVLGADIANGSRLFLRAGMTLGRVLGAEFAAGSRPFPRAVAILGRVLGAKIAE